MKTIELPKSLKPQQSFPLIRLGSSRDGGYLIDKRLLNSDLISFGIAGDWTFEKHWRTRNQSATIETYDGSISGIRFAVVAILSLLRPHKPKLIVRNLINAIDYWVFLKKMTKLQRMFIGNHRRHNWTTYQDVIRDTACKAPFFLKVDIEGHEYEILDEILRNQNKLSGLAIEFHQPITHMKTIEAFIAKLELSICNIHANNCLPKEQSTVEASLEITFSRHKGSNQKPLFPDPLEKDNDPNCLPIRLRFVD